MIEIEETIMKMKEGLNKKMRELSGESRTYKPGSLYEAFLSGAIQGIHYALNYPVGAITMTELEAKSQKEDRIVRTNTKEEVEG